MNNKPQNGYYADIEKKPLIKILRFYFKNFGDFFPNLSVRIFTYLFSTPQKRKIRPRHTKFLNTATKKETFPAENEQIQMYIWQGGNKKILITHGWSGMAADFNEMINVLHNAGFTVMAFDLPAHGFSSGKHTHMPMVMNVLKVILKRYGNFYAMIGHSLGAASTTYTLAEIPDEQKPERLVLLGVPPAPFVFFEQFRSVLAINDKLFDKCVSYIEQKVGRKIQEMAIEKSFPKIQVKNVLIIHDTNDTIIPVEEVKTIANNHENVIFFSGNHGGHFRHYKHPEVVEKVKNFVSDNI